MGGEKTRKRGKQHENLGSPPRGRGKASAGNARQPNTRITPAWAGKSPYCSSFYRSHGDHPRVGGEKHLGKPSEVKRRGSPPRGRGKVPLARHFVHGDGITPAWAGKSPGPPRCPQRAQDHPRVGGEKQMPRRPARFRPGITPAWAGKRLKRSHRSGIFISGPIPFHSVLHRPAGSGSSRAGRDGSPAGQPQNAGPA